MYQWKHPNGISVDVESTAQFHIAKYDSGVTNKPTLRLIESGFRNDSVAFLHFYFERQTGFFLLQIYTPLLVIGKQNKKVFFQPPHSAEVNFLKSRQMATIIHFLFYSFHSLAMVERNNAPKNALFSTNRRCPHVFQKWPSKIHRTGGASKNLQAQYEGTTVDAKKEP